MTLSYYAIRHIASGKLMPQMKTDRGYSHWNPSSKPEGPNMALDVPRLIVSRRKAAQIIVQWACNPNAFNSSYRIGIYGEEVEQFVDNKPDGRKKTDLEIVRFQMIEVNP